MANTPKHGIEPGQIYTSKYGKFKILELIPSVKKENGKGYYLARAKIKFIDTGYVTTVRLDHVKEGNVKDKYKRDVYNVGCIGDMDHFYHDPLIKRIYQIWCGMLSRCYNPNDNSFRFYGALGVKVCDRWLVFKNFYEDFSKLPGYDNWINGKPHEYHLDKDLLQQGVPFNKKVYSPITCILITDSENSIERNIKYHGNFSNEYYGVHNKYNNYGNKSYNTHITENGKPKHLGAFSNNVAAAVYRDWYCRTNNISCIYNYEYPFMYPMNIYESLQYKAINDKEHYKSIHNPYSQEEIDCHKGEMCHIDNVPRYKEMCKIVK